MTLPLAHVDDRIFPAVWKLLRIRLMISIRGFLRAKTRKKIGLIFLYVFIASLVVGVFVGSYYLLGFLTSKDFASFIGNPLPFLLSLPTMLITAGMFIIFLTSFGVLLSALYLSGDMDFLLSAPIPIRSVFVSKMLQAILPNFGLLCLLILPVLFGLGAALGFNFLYYPVMLIVIAALALAVASFASLLVMVLARFVSPRRLAEVLAFFVGIISFTLGQSGNFFRALNVNVSDSQVTSALQGFTRFNTPWSPLAWAGQGLVNLGQGNWLPAAGFLLVTIALSVGIFAIALVTAEKLYYSGWARVQANVGKKKAPRPARAAAAAQPARAARILPAPVRAMVLKDFLVLRRDLRNLSQLMTPLILGVMYGLAILRQGTRAPLGQGNAPQWVNNLISTGFGYADIGIAIFVGWILGDGAGGQGFFAGREELLDVEILAPERRSDVDFKVHHCLGSSRFHRLDLSDRVRHLAASQAAKPAFLHACGGSVLCGCDLDLGSVRGGWRAFRLGGPAQDAGWYHRLLQLPGLLRLHGVQHPVPGRSCPASARAGGSARRRSNWRTFPRRSCLPGLRHRPPPDGPQPGGPPERSLIYFRSKFWMIYFAHEGFEAFPCLF